MKIFSGTFATLCTLYGALAGNFRVIGKKILKNLKKVSRDPKAGQKDDKATSTDRPRRRFSCYTAAPTGICLYKQPAGD
ncbi:hypothetical protein ACSUZJ_09385 [Telluria sp. B2]